jgi:hypothetical protein
MPHVTVRKSRKMALKKPPAVKKGAIGKIPKVPKIEDYEASEF